MRIWARVETGDDGRRHGHLHVDDVISAGPWGGISRKQAVDKLETLRQDGAEHLHVHIHSPGGDAHESLAIHDAVAGWPHGERHTHVEGLAASGASVIAMAGDKIHFTPNSMMMIHPAHGLAIGDASQMRRSADKLEKLDDMLAAIYSKRTGNSKNEIGKMVNAGDGDGTWMTAKEAKTKGFCDVIDQPNSPEEAKRTPHVEPDEPDADEPEGDEPDEGDDEPDEDRVALRFHEVASALWGTRAPAEAMKLLELNMPRAQARTKESTMATFDELRKKTEAAELTSAESKATAETAVKDLAEVKQQMAALQKTATEAAAKLAEAQAKAEATEQARIATEAARVEVEKAKTDLLAATGKQNVAEALAQVEGLKIKAARADDFQAELVKLGAESAKTAEVRKTEEIKALLDAASKDGRLTPAKRAELEKPEAPAFARDPAQLKAVLEMQPKIVVVAGDPAGATRSPVNDAEVVVLDALTRSYGEKLHVDPVHAALMQKDPSGKLLDEHMAKEHAPATK